MLSEISFLAEKVFVHRWPHDTPLWSDEVKKKLDETISKNSNPKQITIKENIIQIQDFEFSKLIKIGISVPFFKDECRMIFECQFGELYAHIHITVKSKEYLEIFRKLKAWKSEFFPNDSNK
ncbi:hypothetical protein [Nitrosopumilus piranensis]|uniref:Uncharacterized protein n=1 Tax=Nitrosopumilus piranensis TaxID=1582439 RepID=A0A0C5BZC8_9ARCH|nr:hypothetical protein [Nitrosopumilus piranensis]AJM92355.1 hypothetical protein NPIRD3C_1143 [Nitrosopumilus piranensis]